MGLAVWHNAERNDGISASTLWPPILQVVRGGPNPLYDQI
jgi:hypothetical protein